MIFQHDDYREILSLRFEERHRRNPAYSRRAYARDLGLSASRLSEVLSRRHHLSDKRAAAVAASLDLDAEERAFFQDLVQSQTARRPAERQSASLRLLRYRFADEDTQLRVDHFKLIADWYHFAILETFKMKGFRSDPKWIAQTLGLKPKTVRVAIERLERLGFLERRGDDLVLRRSRSFTDSYTAPQALRDFHRQALELAAKAVGDRPRAERVSLTAVAAIDAADVEAIRADVTALVNTFTTRRAKQAAADHVYCLTAQLFQLGGGTHADD